MITLWVGREEFFPWMFEREPSKYSRQVALTEEEKREWDEAKHRFETINSKIHKKWAEAR